MKYFKLLVPLAICFFSFAVNADEKSQVLKEKIAKTSKHFVYFDRYKKALAVLEKATENTPAEEIKIAQQITNIFAIRKEMDAIPPSKAIPDLFRLYENDELTDEEIVFYDGMYTNSFADLVYRIIQPKLGVFASQARHPLFFAGIPSQSPVRNPRFFPIFWYYAGYKYMDTFWNDWYSCWKKEQSRNKPREEVLERLADEISQQFNYHIFPYVAQALKSGDTSLATLIRYLPKDGGYHYPTHFYDVNLVLFTDAESFLKFWEENKEDYIIPSPEHTLRDLEHICKRINLPRAFSPGVLPRMLEAEKALAEYSANPNHSLTNTWYYLLED